MSEVEQQILQAMMQDSDALMETVDEDDNEMASVEQAAIVIAVVKKFGCTLSGLFCKLQDRQDMMMAKKQGWIRVPDIFGALKKAILGVATKENFCKAVKFVC